MGFQDNVPIYVQIANEIKEQIISGKVQEGDKLSSVREYSATYEVTTLTIQRAIQLLEREKVIETRKGIGSFVTVGVRTELKSKMVGAQVKEFVVRMKNMGMSDNEIVAFIKEELENE